MDRLDHRLAKSEHEKRRMTPEEQARYFPFYHVLKGKHQALPRSNHDDEDGQALPYQAPFPNDNLRVLRIPQREWCRVSTGCSIIIYFLNRWARQTSIYPRPPTL